VELRRDDRRTPMTVAEVERLATSSEISKGGKVPVTISGKWFRLKWKGCEPGYITTGCKGACCTHSDGKMYVGVLPREEAALRKRGATVKGGLLQPNEKGMCPFQKEDGLCGLHGTRDKPYGCLIGPVLINDNDTLVVRNRAVKLRCYGGSVPGYVSWRLALDTLLGKAQAERVVGEIKAGADMVQAEMDRERYDNAKRLDGFRRRELWGDGKNPGWTPKDKGEVAKALGGVTARLPILKTTEEKYVLGVVLEPNDGEGEAPLDPDTQGDIYSAAEIRQAAHTFMEKFRHIGHMHRTLIDGKVAILESYVAPVSFDIALDGTAVPSQAKAGGSAAGPYRKAEPPTQHVRAGTWLLGLRIKDDAMWRKIKDDKLTGLSIGGSARRVPAQ
jgi:hypothetical protein